jgi:two-component system response regulator CpxR
MDMRRVLLVEDDPEVRLLIEHVLLDAAYEVDTAETFDVGNGLLDSCDYDIVVADARLADGNGVVLAEQARLRGIPSVIITGYAFVLHHMGVDLEQHEVLLKPISPEELLAALAKAVNALRKKPD